jgi:predicted phage terminase large subunit-like protein
VVAVDPAISSAEDSDETGIVVCGLGADGHGYVLADASTKDTPRGWAEAAIREYRRHKADVIVAEGNQGGEMVRHVLATVDPSVPIKIVHATRGKLTRAEPVSSLYERGIIHHVGSFAKLEDQMCAWVAGQTAKSPDRMDAMVWALTELMISQEELSFA